MLQLYKTKLFLLIGLLVSILIISGCGQTTEKTSANKPKLESEKIDGVEKLDNLTIQAPMGISVAAPVYKLIHDDNLKGFTNKVSYLPWKNPDELRARVSAKQAEVSAVPTYVGANLYNRGMDVKLINTLVWGILYVIGPDGEKIGWEDLRGETIYVPFKGDMPDLVFQYLLNKNNIDTKSDINIQYVSSPQEIVQLIVSGKAKYAVVPEHVATLSVIKGNEEGKNIAKIMSLQEEWAKATGKGSFIPQAGILVSNSLIEAHPELVKEIQKQLEHGINYINENPTEAAKIIQTFNEDVPVPVIEQVIPSLNLKFVSAKEAKEDLEFFFTELSTISPDIIGGKLPDEGFYYNN